MKPNHANRRAPRDARQDMSNAPACTPPHGQGTRASLRRTTAANAHPLF